MKKILQSFIAGGGVDITHKATMNTFGHKFQ